MNVSTIHCSADVTEFIEKEDVKGFLARDEAEKLFELALTQSKSAPCLELGSYCGLSTVYMGLAVRLNSGTLYAVDHHRGSEEHQLGEDYHDPDLIDPRDGCFNSFWHFRKTLQNAKLEDTVVPIVCKSELAVRDWSTPLSMVFIDGGHSEAMAVADCLNWSGKLSPGGLIAIHDIFENPGDGGQGPYIAMQTLLQTGEFEPYDRVNSLAILRKREAKTPDSSR